MKDILIDNMENTLSGLQYFAVALFVFQFYPVCN